MASKILPCVLLCLVLCMASHSFAEDNSTEPTFIEENWLVRERADHPGE